MPSPSQRALQPHGQNQRAQNQLAQHMRLFVGALRRAGLKIGPSALIDALQVTRLVGLARRDDFKEALASVLLRRHEDRGLFEQAFALYWRNPQYFQRLLSLILPEPEENLPASKGQEAQDAQTLAQRLAPDLEQPDAPQAEELAIELDLSQASSNLDRLRSRDFASMTRAELEEVRRALLHMARRPQSLTARRWQPAGSNHGPIDMRRALQRQGRSLMSDASLPRRRRQQRPPPLVMLLDISGSMAQYTRVMLFFAHALAQRPDQAAALHVFTLGTRLTNVSRAFRHKDADQSLAEVARLVPDWEGGTRLGSAFADFNRLWARRVLAAGARCLLITDGLERDDLALMQRETQRLARLTPRLIWLNPLLRWDGYEPLAAGARILDAAVDLSLPIHSLSSIEALAERLAKGL
jgi:uncharacterized protein with von Willebrand factor type A (vWA) domain